MIAMLRAQVSLHNRLPTQPPLAPAPQRAVGHFLEGIAQRFDKHVVLAFEVLVKASVCQAGVPHHGGNGGARDAFGELDRTAFTNLSDHSKR